MTDQQKEEEAMFKQTFNFFVQGKNGAPLERYELPMILDGKSTKTNAFAQKLPLNLETLIST